MTRAKGFWGERTSITLNTVRKLSHDIQLSATGLCDIEESGFSTVAEEMPESNHCRLSCQLWEGCKHHPRGLCHCVGRFWFSNGGVYGSSSCVTFQELFSSWDHPGCIIDCVQSHVFSDYRRAFGLILGFSVHLQLVTTSNDYALTLLLKLKTKTPCI
jgi:hypothetical protein